MIQITPAILTNNLSLMQQYLVSFLTLGNIDIDVIQKDYINNETITIDELLENDTLYSYEDIGWHLMVNYPENQVVILLNSHYSKKRCRIYAQQEVELKAYLNLKFPEGWNRCVCLEVRSPLRELEFYNQFDEVQFMSVEIGVQGNKFDPSVLSKVDTLRKMGYNGIVSLDGGINLSTAKLLLNHRIDRVSVGSYLSNADDKNLAYNELKKILNN